MAHGRPGRSCYTLPVADSLRSPLLEGLGFRHAFSLRGVDPEAPADRGHIAASLGCAPTALHQCSQAHGAAVRRVLPGDDQASVRATEADALIASGGAAAGVRVADCAAVLVVDPASGAVAAIHAGWRGTVRGVVAHAIAELSASGSASVNFAAALFPHIRACCFEVGEDVAAEIAAASLARDVVVGGGAKPRVNLAAVIRMQLEQAGLAPARIDDVPGCTKCEPARFFSYRRDGANAGRHLAAIASR